MATKNAINNISDPLASTEITVDPGASGDSYIQFDINSTGKFRVGVDDDAVDAFKISSGSALGTTDRFIMTANGKRTMPYQPAFLAVLRTIDSNVTGAGATFTLGTGNALTIIYDQGGNFNTNGTFTAPVTSKYFLYAAIRSSGTTAAMTDGQISIVTSGRTYTSGWCNPGVCDNFTNKLLFDVSCVGVMAALDTAVIRITISNGAGNTSDIDALGSGLAGSYFCGYLIV